MNKQELIQALKTRRNLCYNRFFEASKDYEANLKLFGDAGHVVVRLDAEKMESENARIEEINEFIHALESIKEESND